MIPVRTLTELACEGYTGGDNQHIPSSPAWFAHELGRYFQASGRTIPKDVRMGRGYSIRANDLRFVIKLDAKAVKATFERVE